MLTWFSVGGLAVCVSNLSRSSTAIGAASLQNNVDSAEEFKRLANISQALASDAMAQINVVIGLSARAQEQQALEWLQSILASDPDRTAAHMIKAQIQ